MIKRQSNNTSSARLDPARADNFAQDSHREALATLRYAIEQSEGWALVTGRAGAGKTELLARLQAGLGPEVQCVRISAENCPTPLELFRHISAALEMGVPCQYKARFMLDLRAHIEACRRQGRKILLLIDSAQKWGPEMLREVELLGNEDQFSPRVLNIFLFARPEFLQTLEGMGATNLKHHLRRFRRLAHPGDTPAPPAERRHQDRPANGIDYFDNDAVKQMRQMAQAKVKAQSMSAQTKAGQAGAPQPPAATSNAPAPAASGGQTTYTQELTSLLDQVFGPAPVK
ncbi:MAG: ATP-binding protein [Proteobacteria bacterium]|nr:ATP-binding protein [Pseudomonadota bacterium]